MPPQRTEIPSATQIPATRSAPTRIKKTSGSTILLQIGAGITGLAGGGLFLLGIVAFISEKSPIGQIGEIIMLSTGLILMMGCLIMGALCRIIDNTATD